ncbi:MAG: efflux RND transporter periplasmic adaptor subunit [Alphaproteobacteria bacterium]|nr:efflux RND transporter periplasmic adaptor subunit [Alphaproteobacteria bacterium]
MSKKTIGLLFVFMILASFLAGAAAVRFADKKFLAKEQPLHKQEALLSFQTESVNPQDVPFTKKYIGYVLPKHEVFVQPFISGFIQKVEVSGGQEVKKGDLLVILKQDEYKASLANAYANTLQAEADFQNQESYFARIQKASKSVSASEFEAAKASYLASKAALEASKAAYELATVNYDYTFVYAPIDGIVGDVSLTEGNYVSPASGALFSIVQYSPMRVVFSISDKEYLDELKKNRPFEDETLTLELPNGDIFTETGHFAYTDNRLNKATTSMAVYADFENVGKILTPNTYVNVLCTKIFKNALTLPKSIVDLEENGNFIYLIRNDVVSKAQVEILASKDDSFIVKNTLQKDDKIILEQVSSFEINKHAVSKEKI